MSKELVRKINEFIIKAKRLEGAVEKFGVENFLGEVLYVVVEKLKVYAHRTSKRGIGFFGGVVDANQIVERLSKKYSVYFAELKAA